MKEDGGIQATPATKHWMADGATPRSRNEKYTWTLDVEVVMRSSIGYESQQEVLVASLR